MQKTRTEKSVCEVKRNGRTVGYLTSEMVEQGKDIALDLAGYEIIAL